MINKIDDEFISARQFVARAENWRDIAPFYGNIEINFGQTIEPEARILLAQIGKGELEDPLVVALKRLLHTAIKGGECCIRKNGAGIDVRITDRARHAVVNGILRSERPVKSR